MYLYKPYGDILRIVTPFVFTDITKKRCKITSNIHNLLARLAYTVDYCDDFLRLLLLVYWMSPI